MATNEILRFAETDTGTNLLTQAEYLADSQRPIGNQPGVARSKLVNKALRQASLIAAGLAEYIADNQANNVTDALTPQNIADYLQAAITGALGVTPPQFDNDTSLATTAFVQRALGSFSGVASYSSAATLTVADVGKAILATGTFTLTLPLASACPAGSVIQVFCNSGVTTVSRQGSDTLQGVASTVSEVLGVGDTITLRSNGVGSWLAVGGSTQLGSSAAFGKSLASNGYQKLPSGLIIQWGSSATGGGGTLAVSFPIAFPNATLAVYGTRSAAESIVVAASGQTTSGFTLSTYLSSTGALAGSKSCAWLAIGY